MAISYFGVRRTSDHQRYGVNCNQLVVPTSASQGYVVAVPQRSYRLVGSIMPGQNLFVSISSVWRPHDQSIITALLLPVGTDFGQHPFFSFIFCLFSVQNSRRSLLCLLILIPYPWPLARLQNEDLSGMELSTFNRCSPLHLLLHTSHYSRLWGRLPSRHTLQHPHRLYPRQL